MTVTLHPATHADLALVKNLVPYYIYDMAEHLGWPCTSEGRFDGCDDLETYFAGERRHAFILRDGLEPAGFVLILADKPEPDVDYSVTDFFVLRKFRRQGVGQRTAHDLFRRFPGRWKVEQFAANQPAVAFWTTIIDRYTKGHFHQRTGVSQWGPLNILLFQTGTG